MKRLSFSVRFLTGALIICLFHSCAFQVVREKYQEGGLSLKYKQKRKTKEKHGFYKMYHENGQLALEMYYKNDKLHGEVKSYYPNGQLENLANTAFDKYEGPFSYWFMDGKLKQEGTYVNNEITGVLKTYYPNGVLKENVTFSNSMENGAYTLFYQDGQRKEEGYFLNGPFPDGLIKHYDAEGRLKRKQSCQAGTCETIWEAD